MAKNHRDVRAAQRHLLRIGQGLEALHAIAQQTETGASAPIDGEVLRQCVSHMTANFLRDLNSVSRALGDDVVVFEPRS